MNNRKLPEEHADVNKYIDELSGNEFNIDTRIRLLVACITLNKSDWKSLEHETKIKAEKWRQFSRGTTKASIDMVEALAVRWPQYALWIITGVTDEKHGHHAPNKMWGFPNPEDENEYQDEPTRGVSHYEKTTAYFKLAAKLVRELWKLGEPRDELGSAMRFRKLIESNKPFGRNLKLLNTLYELKEDEFLTNNTHLDHATWFKEMKNDDQTS